MEKFAVVIDVTCGNTGHWVTGRSRPNLETAVRVADFFDVSLDYLVGRSNDPKRN